MATTLEAGVHIDHAIAHGEGPTDPIVFSHTEAVEQLLAGMHEEFPRPATKLNRLVAEVADRLPEHSLNGERLRGWIDNSLEVFKHLVDDHDVLERIRRETAWVITDETPPDPDVWSGECKFVDGMNPVVVCYTKTLASRLPGSAQELAWQGSVDHFVGHLYPFYRGAGAPADYDEDVACRYQHLAARHRARTDRRYAVIARLMPLTYRLHKQIPTSNYEES